MDKEPFDPSYGLQWAVWDLLDFLMHIGIKAADHDFATTYEETEKFVDRVLEKRRTL